MAESVLESLPKDELFFEHSTDQLRRWHAALVNANPNEPTFAATVGAILRNLIGREITHPDRVERDKANAQPMRGAAPDDGDGPKQQAQSVLAASDPDGPGQDFNPHPEPAPATRG